MAKCKALTGSAVKGLNTATSWENLYWRFPHFELIKARPVCLLSAYAAWHGGGDFITTFTYLRKTLAVRPALYHDTTASLTVHHA